jgi:N-formylglutamate deformylase
MRLRPSFVEPGIFYRYDPFDTPAPVFIDVSRSGKEYPTDMRSPLPFSVMHDNVSAYVEELFGDAPRYGATLLEALVPHMFIDLNRHELDIDPAIVEGNWPVPLQPDKLKPHLGLIKSKSRYGEPVQERKITYAEVQERMDRYYRPYHKEMRRLIEALKAQYGFVYQLTCHCMSDIGAPTHQDSGKKRADFCLGNRFGESASEHFTNVVAEAIRRSGFTCSINEPYSGREITRVYGRPAEGVETIQIEVNKVRFMDLDTFRKTDGYDVIKRAIDTVLEAICSDARMRARSNARG